MPPKAVRAVPSINIPACIVDDGVQQAHHWIITTLPSCEDASPSSRTTKHECLKCGCVKLVSEPLGTNVYRAVWDTSRVRKPLL